MIRFVLLTLVILISLPVMGASWELPALALGPRLGGDNPPASAQAVCSRSDTATRRFIYQDGFADTDYRRASSNLDRTFYQYVGTCVHHMLNSDGEWVEIPAGSGLSDASYALRRYWDVACPTTVALIADLNFKYPTFGEMVDSYYCRAPHNEDCTRVSNPISFATGSKYQEELDYEGSGSFPLRFKRYYNSAQVDGADQIADSPSYSNLTSWKFSYSSSLAIHSGSQKAYMVEDSGRILAFDKVAGEWQNTSGNTAQLLPALDGWEVIDDKDITHLFDQFGRLAGRKDQQGKLQQVERIDGNIIVTNWNGETLTIQLDQQRPFKLIDSEGNETIYTYTSRNPSNPIGDLFETVSYPDGSIRSYQYDFVNSNHLLESISVDGLVISRWEYDSEGRATASEKAGGVNRTELDYTHFEDPVEPRVTVTNPLGKQTTYRFEIVNNTYRTTSVEGHASANCAASSKTTTYDANGHMESSVDWQGVTTTYERNGRGLTSVKTEAVGTPAERTTLTEWHPVLSLKTKITEPHRITHFTYDADGRLLTKTITPRAAP